MNKYIGSQQHWEDSINADYDYKEAMEKEQSDSREQPDDREQTQRPKGIIYWFYYVLALAKRSFN
ncbi:MAG: hypothetical protein HRT69_13885 [Flavobacteriaceae bacterium]|nr:hypothetical protein [Flavobacteriaceae bacterium]